MNVQPGTGRAARRGCRVDLHIRIARLSAVAIAATATVLAACTPAQNGTVDTAGRPVDVVSADSHISMQRLPCYGTCPVYNVSIAANGTVTFQGERYVDTTGTATRTIDPGAAAALMKHLTEGGFFDFARRYTYNEKECGLYHTDAPRVILTMRVDGRENTVEHDYGCNGAPATLRDLQARVDSVAGVERWIGQR